MPRPAPPRCRRRRRFAFLLLGAALAGSPGPAAAENPAPSPLERLRALTSVEGAAVGEAGSEGAFFALSKVLLAKGDAASHRALLAEASPVARAMGLYLLVQTTGKAALPDLRARLSDRARFEHFPAGCCGWQTSVGGFARLLVRNRRHLGFAEAPEPLADAETLLGIDLAVLADDRAANLHDEVRDDLGKDVAAGRLVLRLADVRRVGAGLLDLQRVKAVGRLLADDANRRFLVACLDDTTLAKDARLAAASALTRSTHAEAVAAIRSARAWIDGAAGKALAERLLTTIEARRAHEERWKPIRLVRTWMEHETMRPEIRAALTAERPFAIPDLHGAFGLAVVTGDLREALMASIFRIAAVLTETEASWDTDSEAAYRLETLAVLAWGKTSELDLEERPLRTEERKRLLEALRPHLRP